MHTDPGSKPTALVTGATGLIGKRLAHALLEDGWQVRGLDLRAQPVPFPCVQGDVRDAALVERLIPERGLVFHLASIVGVRNVLEHPSDCHETSVLGTETVARIARSKGTRVVFTSSSEVYGAAQVGSAISEERSLPSTYGAWPRASYPEGKREAETILQQHGASGLDQRIARLFNVSGPGQSAASGMVLPTFVEAAIAGRPLPILHHGEDVRCFQHVEDAVRGLLKLAGDDCPSGTLVNLGSDDPWRVSALAERIAALLHVPLHVRDSSDVDRYGCASTRCAWRVPDTSRARALLAFEARIPLKTLILELAEELRCAASSELRA